MWEKYGTAWQATDDNITQRMSIKRLMTKATDINWELCNTRCFSTATMVARTRLNVMLYKHCLSYNVIFRLSRFSKWTFQVFRLILVNNQLDTLFFRCIYLFHFSTCFEQHSAHHQENRIVSVHHLVYITLCR